MKEKTQLITQLLQSIRVRKDLTYLIATADQHTAMISIKDGKISYLRFGVFVGVEALSPLQNMEVRNFAERKHSLEHPKNKLVLPSTQEILQTLCANLPNTLQEYQSRVRSFISDHNKAANAVSVGEIVRTVRNPTIISNTSECLEPNTVVSVNDFTWVMPVEPKHTEILESVTQTVKAALQEIIGPIANFIYEDTLKTVHQVNSRDSLAHLINTLVMKIDQHQYQKQFLKILKERLIGIITIM